MATQSLTNFAEDAWMNHIFGSAHSHAAAVYLALCTGSPGEAATGAAMTEVADTGSYARKAITFDAAAARKIVQAAAVVFTEATGSWGTVSHWAIVDSITYGAGNCLAYGEFDASFGVVSGNVVTVPDEEVTIEIAAGDGEGFTTQLCGWMLDFMFSNVDYAAPATYVALLDAVGEDADTTLAADEVAGTDYARVLVNHVGGATPHWDTVASGATQNAHDIDFGTVGAGNWSTVVGAAIVDVSDNVLMYDNDQVVNQTPIAGDTVKFVTNAFDISLS